jgi:putative tryptophan/tyrosine transport system substrate-binding protein
VVGLKRRDFITLLGGAAASPLTAHAQQPSVPVVGFLGVAPAPLRAQLAALHRALAEAGYVDGRNIRIEYRWSAGDHERMRSLAAELAALPVDVLLATSGDAGALAAKGATTTIPVVFIAGSDPVKLGLVPSLARPGGNATGVHVFTTQLEEKRIGLLRQLVPSAATLGMLANPQYPATELQVDNVREATRRIGLKLAVVTAATDSAIESAFASFVEQRAEVLLVAGDPFFNSRRDRIVALAAHHKLPAMSLWAEFAVAGGLASYGPSLADAYRQAGIYVARILKGEKPGELPIVQPTQFEFVINLKTSKALQLEVPATLQLLADEVIE